MNQKTTDTIFEALAERINQLKMDIYLKDAQIESCEATIKELERQIKELRYENN